jgi:hypothetical protein
MSSDSSAVETALAGYVAGRLTADALAPVVAAAYYGAPAEAQRAALRPVLDVVERAAPGVVALARADGTPGFVVAPGDRAFAPAYETALRDAAAAALRDWPVAARRAGMLDRLWGVMRRWLGR